MNTPGIYIFNNVGTLSKSSTFVNEDGFIIVKNISGSYAKQLDVSLAGKGITIDSDGHVWDYASSKIIVYNTMMYDPSKTVNIAPTPSYTISISSQLPLTNGGVNPFLSGISKAKYFVSLPRIPTIIGEAGNIGGWLLSNNGNGTYCILYNPLNRSELFTQNQPDSIYNQYCEVTSLQDKNCYCITQNLTPNQTDESGNYCYYSSLEPAVSASYNGKSLGTDLEALASSGTNVNLASTINNIKDGCNCMGTCRTIGENNSNIPLWTNFKNLFDIGTCPTTQNFEISACTTDITAGKIANINAAVTVTCPSNIPVAVPTSSSAVPTSSSAVDNHSNMYIIIGVLIVVAIIAYILIRRK